MRSVSDGVLGVERTSLVELDMWCIEELEKTREQLYQDRPWLSYSRLQSRSLS